MDESAPIPPMNITQAEVAITEICQEVSLMGANDFEIPAIRDLLDQLHEGKLTPEEAVKKAHEIQSFKADYH